MKAVVVGGTGAIGQHVVGQLLTAEGFNVVATVGRREVTVPEQYSAPKAELQQYKVDMDKLGAEGAAAFEGASAVFCCLGTTRKDAGSAEQFKKVDYEYVAATAQAAKAAGVKHFSLVTAQGANPNVWANDWGIFHGLLYMKTKGLAEEAVKRQGLASTSIFRPGLLDREAKARSNERTFSSILTSIPVSGVAKLMVADAQRALSSAATATAPITRVFEMPQLLKALKDNMAP